MDSSARLLSVVSLLLLSVTSNAEENIACLQSDPAASSLVQAALEAEVEGDARRREALLTSALERAPHHAPARWQSGSVMVDDQWVTLEQAEQNAIDNELIAAYRDLKQRSTGRLAGEVSLARWCRKNAFVQRERMHWSNVLRLDSSNREARGRLGVHEFQGQLLTTQQIGQWKAGLREHQRALQHWTPKLNRWRREIESASLPQLTDAWHELTSVDEASAVPSLERMFYRAELGFQRKTISVLGKIKGQIATDALVRIGLYAGSSELRHAAATELGERSWFGFVPTLLSRLETPVQYRYTITTLEAGVASEIRFSKEDANVYLNTSHSVRTEIPLYIVSQQTTPRNLVRMKLVQQRKIAEEAAKQYRQVAEAVQQVEQTNARRIVFNDRVYTLLATATGMQLEPHPKYWWEWWSKYNELDDTEEKPSIDLRWRRSYERPIRLSGLSCFAAGTPVWTETGPVAIEDVRSGDRVLSQNPESGELAYRVVLDTTVRPPSRTVRLQVADDEIVATLGHPFWVVGRGWTMAKELKADQQLHGVRGGVTIDSIQPGEASEAFNLVVAGNNNYFVGKHRLLVHDNMARRVLDIPVPGWAADSGAGKEKYHRSVSAFRNRSLS